MYNIYFCLDYYIYYNPSRKVNCGLRGFWWDCNMCPYNNITMSWCIRFKIFIKNQTPMFLWWCFFFIYWLTSGHIILLSKLLPGRSESVHFIRDTFFKLFLKTTKHSSKNRLVDFIMVFIIIIIKIIMAVRNLVYFITIVCSVKFKWRRFKYL